MRQRALRPRRFEGHERPQHARAPINLGEKLERGERITKAERAHYLLDTARVGRECEEAVMLLFKPMGARGIFLSNPMQRFLRDTIAGANHITQNADDTAGLLGGYLLGQELPDMVFGKD